MEQHSVAAHTNRLIHSTSPYLLQHAHNPVDWNPWDAEALARARREDKPIFLSIGYSACHWCHVMERESFESRAVADLLNAHFVPVKVDREERPDLDEIYMSAVTAMTGAGGWPMSVFLTPDLEPFYGGTYYPPDDRYGRPGFPRVLASVAAAWRERRGQVTEAARDLVEHVGRQLAAAPADSAGPISHALAETAARDLGRTHDRRHGGWGGAPKFPNSGAMSLLLRHHRRTGAAESLEMALRTLDRMARGGMRDHLGGGFHRYSVDDEWLVPHFEKMLYDNALLAGAYLEAFQATGDAAWADTARSTLAYVLRDLQGPEGGYYSSEDADSEGEEGRFYLWRAEELETLLGREDAALFARVYGVASEGNFSSHEPYHAGQNIPHLPVPMEEAAQSIGLPVETLRERMEEMRLRLFTVREGRVRPGLDDKCLAAWNGMAVSAMARGGAVLGEPRFLESARRAARFLLDHMMPEGALQRSWRAGHCSGPGYLDDHAWAAEGFLDLYEATLEPEWIAAALGIAETMLAEFADPAGPGLFHAGKRHTDLLVRSKPFYDGAEPSGNAVAARVLERLSRHADRPAWHDTALAVVQSRTDWMERAAQACLVLLGVAELLLAPPVEVVVAVGDLGMSREEALREIHRHYLPGVTVAGTTGNAEGDAKRPLLAGKQPVGGKTAVYVCRDRVCGAPVTELGALREALGAGDG